MKLLSLAWRNILRNRRRTAFTLASVTVATAAMLMLGGYVKATVRALETDTVRGTGHLQIMSKGFLEFGRGNTARFAIADPDALVQKLKNDPALKEMLVTVTPTLQVQGVVGNYSAGTSTNFAGSGWEPEARSLMMEWDGNNMRLPPGAIFMNKDQPSAGVIGVGLAQLLGMCESLRVKNCEALPAPAVDANAPAISADLAQLAQSTTAATKKSDSEPISVELMSAGAGGAPNVVRMEVLRAQRQGVRDFDAMYAGMPLALAQRLLFGPDGKGASAVVVQLKRTADLDAARARIVTLLGSQAAQFEVNDYHVVQPSFDQVVNMFTVIFRFVSVLMAIVTLFTVANTINMAVSERIGEIGTLRAVGFKRWDIRGMFLIEGALIGAIGAAIGSLVGTVVGETIVNFSNLSWTPPGRSTEVPVAVDILGNPDLILITIALFSVLACASSWWPARRASKLEIVEALRHV